MELRHLRYFVAVAEELHFRRAAERLHVAQPAVSEQVRKLEQELGVRLFDRTQRSVSMTSAGTALLEEARRVLQQADVARAAARNAGKITTTRLRIGYPPDALPARVNRAIQTFANTTPRVELRLETAPALRLIEELRAGRLDIAVVGLPAPTSGLRVTQAGRERLVAALRVTHPQAIGRPTTLERLAPERLVTLPAGVNPALDNAVTASCREAGLSPSLFEVGEPRLEHALLAVAAGTGVALLPESVAAVHAAPGVRFISLEPGGPSIESAVITRRDSESLETRGFLRALARLGTPAAADQPAISLAA